MSQDLTLTTPQQAIRAMTDAGAIFSVRRRDDELGLSFTFRVAAGGDLKRCRQILAAVKGRPAAFYEAFRAAVQDEVKSGERSAA